MENQEIFNRVLSHLIEQNCLSVDSFGNPRYRTADWLKCPVGCLIDDENYSTDLEDMSVMDKEVIEALEKSLGVKLSESNLELLGELQSCHDDSGFWSDEVDFAGLKEIAEAYGLDV